LKTELEYIRLYLQIEQTRLHDRLEVQFSIDPDALDAAVPNLILLPLIEGAIANGVSVRPGRARIGVQARPDADELRLTVRESAADPQETIGAVAIDESFVQKTKMRLELLYPGRHHIGISDRLEKGHEVEFTVPLSPARLETAAQGAA
jgi:LytS/YehU family sensor histidine kinase